MPLIQCRALADQSAEILVFGSIGEDRFGDGTTARQFDQDLKALGELREILVRINSPGGALFDGVTIYNALKAHRARIVVQVEGLAASAASVIAMAGDVIRMAAGTQLMIHSPWSLSIGDAADHRKTADTLDQCEQGMIDIYTKRSGLSREKVKEMLDQETWFSAQSAIDHGFADELVSTEESEDAAARVPPDYLKNFRNVPHGVFAMPNPAQQPNSSDAILARERDRRTAVRELFDTFPQFATLRDRCLDDPKCDLESTRVKLLDELGRQSEPLAGGANVQPGIDRAIGDDFAQAAVDALLIRAGISVENPSPAARDLRRMSALDMARTCLSRAGRSSRLGFSSEPDRTFKAALTTSDFPSILENALGKVLRNGYETEPQSHRAWVHATQVPDFKTQSRLLLGSAPPLEQVIEAGEYKYGAMTENKTTLAVTKYGKMLLLSWEALINDDLSAFMRIPQAMGAAARRLEADKVYEIFSANSGNGQTMQDTVALFHSSHANVSATVGAIAVATLGAARALLRKQQALGGGYLNLVPRFLIVPAESETLAEQVLTAATRHTLDTIATNQRKIESQTPEWISRLTLVVDPRLNASYGFYLAAGYDQVDTVELATLAADEGGPVLEEQNEFDRDAKHYKVRHTFVAKAIDWKGLVRVPVSG